MSFWIRYSAIKTVEVSTGMHPSELWGVSSGPKVRRRGAKARARRGAKRAARLKGMPLKAYLRQQEKTKA